MLVSGRVTSGLDDLPIGGLENILQAKDLHQNHDQWGVHAWNPMPTTWKFSIDTQKWWALENGYFEVSRLNFGGASTHQNWLFHHIAPVECTPNHGLHANKIKWTNVTKC